MSINATGFVSKEGQSKTFPVPRQVPGGSRKSPEGLITCEGGGGGGGRLKKYFPTWQVLG